MNAMAQAACLLACVATGCAPVPQQAEPPAAPPPPGPVGASIADVHAIPPRFRGEWNRVPADCGTGLNDSRLMLSSDRVAFYESGGPVASVTHHGDDEIGVAVELAGEGQCWTAHYRFRLSDDGRTLTDIGSGGLVRHRCG